MPDEDQLYEPRPPYRPRQIIDTVPTDPIAERLALLPTRLDIWRAALLATLTGAALVIGLDRAVPAAVPVAMATVTIALIVGAAGLLIGYRWGWTRATREAEAFRDMLTLRASGCTIISDGRSGDA